MSQIQFISYILGFISFILGFIIFFQIRKKDNSDNKLIIKKRLMNLLFIIAFIFLVYSWF